jgi:hypothetical protein
VDFFHSSFGGWAEAALESDIAFVIVLGELSKSIC